MGKSIMIYNGWYCLRLPGATAFLFGIFWC